MKEIYLKNRKMSTHYVANTMGISLGQVHRILNNHQHMQWNAVSWVTSRTAWTGASIFKRVFGEREGEKKSYLSKMITVTKHRPTGTAEVSMTLPQFKQNYGMHLPSLKQRTLYSLCFMQLGRGGYIKTQLPLYPIYFAGEMFRPMGHL